MGAGPSYEGYVAWGGLLGADEFHASLGHALAFLRGLTWPNEPEGEARERAWERAAYACVDADAAHGASGGAGDGATSVSVGSFSESWGREGSAQAGWAADMRRAAERELAGSGLLWMGLR